MCASVWDSVLTIAQLCGAMAPPTKRTRQYEQVEGEGHNMTQKSSAGGSSASRAFDDTSALSAAGKETAYNLSILRLQSMAHALRYEQHTLTHFAGFKPMVGAKAAIAQNAIDVLIEQKPKLMRSLLGAIREAQPNAPRDSAYAAAALFMIKPALFIHNNKPLAQQTGLDLLMSKHADQLPAFAAAQVAQGEYKVLGVDAFHHAVACAAATTDNVRIWKSKLEPKPLQRHPIPAMRASNVK